MVTVLTVKVLALLLSIACKTKTRYHGLSNPILNVYK